MYILFSVNLVIVLLIFQMSSVQWFVCALVLVCVSMHVSSAPAPAPQEENYPPMPVSMDSCVGCF